MAEKIKVLRVVARKDSFRRAGFQFGSDAVHIPMDQLSKAQLNAIVQDRQLVATELEVDPETLDPTPGDKGDSEATDTTAARGRRNARRG